MREVGELVSLQVEDCDPISASFSEDDFGLVEHAHRVHWYLEVVLEENGSIFVDMGNSIPSVTEQPQEDKGLITGSVKIQYLSILLRHLYLKMFSQYHKKSSFDLSLPLCHSIARVI